MSRENVEIVRKIYDAVARRDDETPFEFYAEDIVLDLSRWDGVVLDSRLVSRGHDAVRQVWRDRLSAFGDIDYEVDEWLDADDKVLAVVREFDVGRASGISVDASHVAVWTLAEGKVIRLQVFNKRDEALEAAGLAE